MCSAPQNTHILTAQIPLSKKSATFLKTISFWDTLYKFDFIYSKIALVWFWSSWAVWMDLRGPKLWYSLFIIWKPWICSNQYSISPSEIEINPCCKPSRVKSWHRVLILTYATLSLPTKRKSKVCQPRVILCNSRQWSWDCLMSV